ncbi:MAG TPA: META domain-containing protein [Candidatus Obscuribacterales bacterium]
MSPLLLKSWLSGPLAIALMLGGGVAAIADTAPTPLPSSPPTITMLDPLELTPWQLVSYRAADGATVAAVGDNPAILTFAQGRLTGTTGCNRFFSPYQRDGATLTLAAGGSTLMACVSAALAQQETALLTGLTQVASYAQVGQQLTLLDATGATLFTLAPQAIAPLTDTEWTLTAYYNGRGGLVTPLSDTRITARFTAAQGLVGSAGCNQYRAAYTVADSTLTIGAAASTRRLCATPPEVMTQEAAFLQLLPQVATYDINGQQLTLKNAEGMVLASFATAL